MSNDPASIMVKFLFWYYPFPGFLDKKHGVSEVLAVEHKCIEDVSICPLVLDSLDGNDRF